LLAFCHSLMTRYADGESLLNVTGQFLRPVKPGPFEVVVDQLRKGSRLSTVRTHLFQDEQLALVCASTFGAVISSEPPLLMPTEAPAIDPLAACRALPHMTGDGRVVAITEVMDVRLAPSDAGWLDDAPSNTARMRGWIGHCDQRRHDVLSAVLACDLIPPAARNLGVRGWLPTVGFTINLRAEPDGRWLVGHSHTAAAASTLDESLELWDPDGHLIAQAQQLRIDMHRW
jgi:hypothetical protein